MKHRILYILPLFLMQACGSPNVGTTGTQISLSDPIDVTWGSFAHTVYEEDGQLSVQVELSEAAPQDVTIDIQVAQSSTVDSLDYMMPNSVVIMQGQTSATLDITFMDDDDAEATEQMVLELVSSQSIHATAGQTLSIEIKPSDHNYLYLTSTTYTGNIDGFSGATLKCQSDSFASGSLVSFPVISVYSNFDVASFAANFSQQDGFDVDYPIQDKDGKIMYHNWAAFLTQAPLQSISDLNIGITGQNFWSGTDNGTLLNAPADCNNFSSSSASAFGSKGRISDSGVNFWDQSASCANTHSLMCVGINN